MNIDSIKNGIVIDHIEAGKGMEIYNLLRLDLLDCSVAIIKNASSSKMCRKDIIKIDAEINLDMDILGYVAPTATVDIIKNGELCEKKKMTLPQKLTNVIFCKNPRCITTTEQELPNIFNLTNSEKREYRCAYCETRASEK